MDRPPTPPGRWRRPEQDSALLNLPEDVLQIIFALVPPLQLRWTTELSSALFLAAHRPKFTKDYAKVWGIKCCPICGGRFLNKQLLQPHLFNHSTRRITGHSFNV